MTLLLLAVAIGFAIIAADGLRRADDHIRYRPPHADPRPASWQPEHRAPSRVLDHPPTRVQALNSLSTIIAEQRQRSL